jgi:peroxiredoxin
MNYLYHNIIKTLTVSAILLTELLTVNNVFAAQKSVSVGPELGTIAPAITVTNDQGKNETIQSLSAEKGLVILFFRSADWCPFCKKHVIELNKEAKSFTDLGYGLAGISYDNNEILHSFSAEKNISYPLLSDQQAKTMLAYGILNTEYNIGDSNYGIPYPGVVVINKEGVITHKAFFKGYKNRVKFTELYTELTTSK